MLWLPPRPIHSSFVSETWTGAWGGHSILSPRAGISGPDHFQMAVGLCGAPPATAEPECRAAAAFVLGEAVLKGGLLFGPRLHLLGTTPPLLAGTWFCAGAGVPGS